mmetsp:Transcript_9325/g.17854  ORF Transcript_9325/g.17854 Transcript_9325/m.17854 type:complete len:629 (+) Transcript_9325:7150-9036(+)
MKGQLTRKQLRKEQRLEKKQRRHRRPVREYYYEEPVEQPEELPEEAMEEDDYLDWQINYLEKKLGLRKKRKSTKTDEEQQDDVERNLKKYRKQLDDEGLGSDLLDLLEGKGTIQEAEEEAEFEEPVSFRKSKIKLAEDPDKKWEHKAQKVQKVVEPEEQKQVEAPDYKKLVRSIMNKLADSNIDPLTNQLVGLFGQYGFSNVCGEIWEVIEQNLSSSFVPQQLLAVYAAALVGLAKYTGKEVLGFMLAKLSQSVLTSKHAAFLWNFLFVFGGVSSDLHAEVLMIWAQDLNEKAVELLIDSFNITGFKLRKSDPVKLKTVLDSIDASVARVQAGSRHKFMLEILSDVRANRKRPAEDRLAFLKTWLKKTVAQRKTHNDIILKCTWADLQSPNWRAALSNKSEAVPTHIGFALDPQLEALAAAQHMNTDLRKQIFAILMTSEDYVDALSKLKSVKKAEREVIRVLIACCAQEQIFNEFYVLLATHLCKEKPSYKYSYQYALWDHLKQMDDYSLRKISNLAKLTARLIGANCISVNCLKILDFGALNSHQSIFLRVVLEHVLAVSDLDSIEKAFSKPAKHEELTEFCEGLRIFARQVLKKHARESVVEAAGGAEAFSDKLEVLLECLKRVS